MKPSAIYRLDRASTALSSVTDECAASGCSVQSDPAAPVPLCRHHLRVAFAFVLANDNPDLADAREAMPHWSTTAKPTGWVYFIRVGDLVKIGYTSQPDERFRRLQPSEVLHMEAGTMVDEKRCHLLFAHLRVEGEMFRPEPDLLSFIADLQAKAA